MKKVLVIVGPTAVGKTSLGVNLATKLNGAIISADSVQVYKGLDIISGKDLPKLSQFKKDLTLSSDKYNIGFHNFNKIPVFLLDVVLPSYNFSVSDFVKAANSVLSFIQKQNKLPVIVGGTGFYVNAMFKEIETINVARDENLRKKLENKNVAELQEVLIQNDKKKFDSMNNSDRNNPQRLVRAIEVTTKNQKPKTKNQNLIKDYDVLYIGLKCSLDSLKKRINARIKERIEKGAFKEAESLFQNYNNLSSQVKTAIGYRELFEFLKGNLSRQETIEKWKTSEHQLIKKQMTWFLKDKRIKWFDIKDKNFREKLEELVIDWYNKGI